MICVTCNTECEKINDGPRPSGHTKFVDGSGRQWHGNTCPKCRYTPKNVAVKTRRRCRECNMFLTKDRYFKCFNCQPVLPSEDSYATDYNFIAPTSRSAHS